MGEMMMRTVGMALVFGCETKADALSEYFSHVKTGQVERDGEKEFISLDSGTDKLFFCTRIDAIVRVHIIRTCYWYLLKKKTLNQRATFS